MNKVYLHGYLGANPRINAGEREGEDWKIASIRVATNEYYKDSDSDETKQHTDWHTVVVKNKKIANFVENSLESGSQVIVEGRLSTRKWEDKDGKERYSTEVVVSGNDGRIYHCDRVAV